MSEIKRCDVISKLFQCLRPPTYGFRWDNFHKILHVGQMIAKVQSGEKQKNIAESFNPLSTTRKANQHGVLFYIDH